MSRSRYVQEGPFTHTYTYAYSIIDPQAHTQTHTHTHRYTHTHYHTRTHTQIPSTCSSKAPSRRRPDLAAPLLIKSGGRVGRTLIPPPDVTWECRQRLVTGGPLQPPCDPTRAGHCAWELGGPRNVSTLLIGKQVLLSGPLFTQALLGRLRL